jgi:hypothetical protein
MTNVDLLKLMLNQLGLNMKSGMSISKADFKTFETLGFDTDSYNSLKKLVKSIDGWVAGSYKSANFNYHSKAIQLFQKLFAIPLDQSKLYFVGEPTPKTKSLFSEKGSSVIRTSKIGVLNWSYVKPHEGRCHGEYIIRLNMKLSQKTILLTNVPALKVDTMLHCFDTFENKFMSHLGQDVRLRFYDSNTVLPHIGILLDHLSKYSYEREVITVNLPKVRCVVISPTKDDY